MLCRECGQIQVSEVVYPEVIYKNYIYETVSSLGLVKHFSEYAAHTMTTIKPELGTLVVDIGSNDGTLLKAFKDSKMKVLGIDPAINIARDATKRGIETIPKFFTPTIARKIMENYGYASIICANNILANIDDLDKMIESAKILLSSDGVLIFESFYFPDLMKHLVFDFIYHEHLTCFTVTPVQAYFKRLGMELIDVLRVPTKGGSIRYTVQFVGGPRKIQKSVSQILKSESKNGVDKVGIYKSFENKIQTVKAKITALLTKLNQQGKIIAGYGASATSTTFIYHFKLQNLLSFLVDDYVRKQNTYSPGCHIPVLAPEMISIRKPDYILILAWRYADPIIQKNQAFLKYGGKFIIPLPKLKIIDKSYLQS